MISSDSARQGMMHLWKTIFKDSNDYVSLIFNNYFDKDLCAFKEENGNIIASILGVPYNFQYQDKILKGLYLCGISTLPEYRRKGVMSSLLQQIEIKALGKFDFLFLIPSNESNRIIYKNKGFYDGIYKVYQYYTSAHDFKSEFESTLFCLDERVRKLKEDVFNNLKISIIHNSKDSFLEEVICFVKEFEGKPKNYLNLQHSERDIRIAI